MIPPLYAPPAVVLGLKANWSQFTLLVIVNAFVGAMLGLERTILPLLAEQQFGLRSNVTILSFIISFGLVKALANLFAGRLSDQWGRKQILIIGWLLALPVPLLLIYAPNWNWVIFANALLGINQGFCWSTTVVMKIDLAGPQQRGLALGLNEFAGYVALASSALLATQLADSYGLRPMPFYLGFVFALVGLLLSIFAIQETKHHSQAEAQLTTAADHAPPSFAQIFRQTSWQNPTLFAISQAGLVNNLNDGVVWGLVPLYLAQFNTPLAEIGLLTAAYPAVWGFSQLVTGWLSDQLGRRWLIVGGMWLQAAGIALLVVGRSFSVWLAAVVFLGIGTAMVYPTLLAAISDTVHPTWRSSSIGVYRLWRDSGYAIGALMAGLLADRLGLAPAVGIIAGLTFFSGVVAWVYLPETLKTKPV